MSEIEFVIRPGRESDTGFICDAFVNSLRAANSETKAVAKEFFFPHHHARVAALVGRVEVRVAAPPDDDITAYGFAILEPARSVIHFVYTKKPWRRLGIAKALLADMNLGAAQYTSWTRDMYDWGREKYPGLRYNPFVDDGSR